MKMLYVTAVWNGLNEQNMHVAFVKEAALRGHDVTVLALCEKRTGIQTSFEQTSNIKVLSVRCGNIQKTNKYEKVISSVLANFQMIAATRKYLKKERYDVVVWSVSTTLIYYAVHRICKRFHAREYLLLKEYWPQDPVDLGAIRPSGLVYGVFKHVEKTMLNQTDYIGVSSEAGIRYVEERYPQNVEKCEVCPHCEDAIEVNKDTFEEQRKKYGISTDKVVLLYGGNFGVSQGVDDMVKCIKATQDIQEIEIVLLGSGTEFEYVKDELEGCCNVKFFDGMKYKEFFSLASACDCGMIFLFKGYHVPNIPGKLNTYLNAEIPIIACVDNYTDAGEIIERGNAGISVPSGDEKAFRNAVMRMLDSEQRMSMKKAAKKLLLENYTPDKVVGIVEKRISVLK